MYTTIYCSSISCVEKVILVTPQCTHACTNMSRTIPFWCKILGELYPSQHAVEGVIMDSYRFIQIYWMGLTNSKFIMKKVDISELIIFWQAIG